MNAGNNFQNTNYKLTSSGWLNNKFGSTEEWIRLKGSWKPQCKHVRTERKHARFRM